MVRSVDELTGLLRQGREFEFLFFWGHQPENDGTVGKGCLSQWAPSTFEVDGHTFPTAEHYMMWRKAKLFDDDAVAEEVLRTAEPRRVKELGRRVRRFDEARWAADRYGIVLAGSLAKFGQLPELRAYLLGTADRILVEASPMDRVWGIGLRADDPRAATPDQWRGLNLLGFALTEARATLAAG